MDEDALTRALKCIEDGCGDPELFATVNKIEKNCIIGAESMRHDDDIENKDLPRVCSRGTYVSDRSDEESDRVRNILLYIEMQRRTMYVLNDVTLLLACTHGFWYYLVGLKDEKYSPDIMLEAKRRVDAFNKQHPRHHIRLPWESPYWCSSPDRRWHYRIYYSIYNIIMYYIHSLLILLRILPRR